MFKRFRFLLKNNISPAILGRGSFNKIERRLPKTAGVYVFKDNKQLLYIGKAVNIKKRVKNHFQQPTYRDNLFLDKITKVGYIKTDSEIEALLLEAKLIKKYQSKFNVLWRDDKNYFYVGITKEDFPAVFITHQPLRQAQGKPKLKINYIGPFVDGSALKQTLKVLRKVFPYRTCRILSKRPCLWYQLNRCSAPCLVKSDLSKQIPTSYRKMKKECQENIKNLKQILQGKKKQTLKDLKIEMKEAALLKRFERAVQIRDQIISLERILSHALLRASFAEVATKAEQGLRTGKAKVIESPEIQERQWDSIQKIIQKITNSKIEISRIEAYDISNIQGKEATGAMVTFVKGLPDKNYYRRFKIRIAGKPNDTAMIKEVLRRRFLHPEWRYPDLILIDGGKAQLSAALSCKLQNADYKLIKIVALAKKNNELYIEHIKKPILLKSLPREIFNLILQLRDEAHRFALRYHLKLRRKELFG